MHTFKKLLSVAMLATAIPITTQAYETSGNITLATDYKFRGISQNATSPAVSGGFDIAFDNGFYAGIWGSNVDFELAGSANPSMELDYYGGFGGNFTEDLSYDVGVLYYDYPTSSETTFSKVTPALMRSDPLKYIGEEVVRFATCTATTFSPSKRTSEALPRLSETGLPSVESSLNAT